MLNTILDRLAAVFECCSHKSSFKCNKACLGIKSVKIYALQITAKGRHHSKNYAVRAQQLPQKRIYCMPARACNKLNVT